MTPEEKADLKQSAAYAAVTIIAIIAVCAALTAAVCWLLDCNAEEQETQNKQWSQTP